MKKTLLLCTIICVGQLYSMDPTSLYELRRTGPVESSYQTLPSELKQQIINKALEKALAAGKNVDEVITVLKNFSILHRIDFNKLFNLQDFTELVHLLAYTFDYDMAKIAEKFNTSIAHTYKNLGVKLLNFASTNSEDAHTGMIKLIKEGADVNFKSYTAPLEAAIVNGNLEGVKILLNSGAQVTYYDVEKANNAAHWYGHIDEYIKVKQLIEKRFEEQFMEQASR